jgi:hypothetical protein
VNAAAIVELLRYRHAAPEWATFTELHDSTGYWRRSIDVYALSCWPSAGQRAIAYEIKVSRADFAHELQEPDKRKGAEGFSTECYFATPAGLVRVDEVPEGWGLVEVNGDGLRRVKMAAQRAMPPLPYWFVASIARRAADPPSTVPLAVIRYLDTTVTPDMLMVAAEGLFRQKHADDVRRALENGHREWAEQEGLSRLKLLARAVQCTCGAAVTTGDAFEAWVASRANTALSPRDKQRISDAIAVLRQLTGGDDGL